MEFSLRKEGEMVEPGERQPEGDGLGWSPDHPPCPWIRPKKPGLLQKAKGHFGAGLQLLELLSTVVS